MRNAFTKGKDTGKPGRSAAPVASSLDVRMWKNQIQKEVTTVMIITDSALVDVQSHNRENQANANLCELWVGTEQWAVWCLTFACLCEECGCMFRCMVPSPPERVVLQAP